jgi:hypothetical protein
MMTLKHKEALRNCPERNKTKAPFPPHLTWTFSPSPSLVPFQSE